MLADCYETTETEVTPYYFVRDKLSSKVTAMADKKLNAETAFVGCFISLMSRSILSDYSVPPRPVLFEVMLVKKPAVTFPT